MEQTPEEIRTLKIQRRIWKLRRQGTTWLVISERINEEFNILYKIPAVKDLYDSYAARENVIANTTKNGKKEAVKVTKEFSDEMKSMMESVRSKAQKHLDIADEMLIEQYEAGNSKAYFRNLPVAISLFRAVLDQINTLDKRLEKINITQNNLILNETQILQLVNKTFKQKEKETGLAIHPGSGQLIVLDDKKK
jgi:hypothetical protein